MVEIEQLENERQRDEIKSDENPEDHHHWDDGTGAQPILSSFFCVAVAQVNVKDKVYLRSDMQRQHRSDGHHRSVKVGVVGFAHARVEPHAVMVEVVHALVAEFAMHGLLRNFLVADPAVLGGFVFIPPLRLSVAPVLLLLRLRVVVVMAVGMGVTVSICVRTQPRIRRIDGHGHVGKVRGRD